MIQYKQKTLRFSRGKASETKKYFIIFKLVEARCNKSQFVSLSFTLLRLNLYVKPKHNLQM